MSDPGFQVQILMADEAVAEFLADPGLEAARVRILDTEPANNTAAQRFDPADTITLINLVVTGVGDIGKLTSPLARLLKKSGKPVVVSTAFATLTLEPTNDPSEVRRRLGLLAAMSI